MAKALDLRQYQNEKIWGLTLLDGTKLEIVKPSQEMVIHMQRLEQLDENNDEEVKDAYDDLTLRIINSNREGKIYDSQYIKDQLNDIQVQFAIVMSYWEFIKELLNVPNLKSPASQEEMM